MCEEATDGGVDVLQRNGDGLDLRIGFDTFRTVLAADAGLFVSAKGYGHVETNTAIDPYRACLN